MRLISFLMNASIVVLATTLAIQWQIIPVPDRFLDHLVDSIRQAVD